ncbi:MAG: hypothetical protein JEZ07_01995 [Phycisphaerae bacterium]|nr:hypothetical protein [Phycisphaerae bacterium]
MQSNDIHCWRGRMSALKLAILIFNVFMFGCFLILLLMAAIGGALIFLTIGLGLSLLTGIVRTLKGSRQISQQKSNYQS